MIVFLLIQQHLRNVKPALIATIREHVRLEYANARTQRMNLMIVMMVISILILKGFFHKSTIAFKLIVFLLLQQHLRNVKLALIATIREHVRLEYANAQTQRMNLMIVVVVISILILKVFFP